MNSLKFSLANKVRKLNSLTVEYELGQTDIKIICKTLMKGNFIEYSYTLFDKDFALLYLQIDGLDLDEYYIYPPLDTQDLVYSNLDTENLNVSIDSFNQSHTYKKTLKIARKVIQLYLNKYLK